MIHQTRHTQESGVEPDATVPLDADGLLPLVVGARREESAGVVSLILEDPEGRSLPTWTPGSHIDVHLPSGLVRQYSLCSDPADTGHWRLGILRVEDGRGGSREAHEVLREGTPVRVGLPRNNFTFEDSPRYLFLAGGIGITPLLPMLHMARTRGRECVFVYGGRTLDSMAFTAEVDGDSTTLVPQETHGHIDLASLLGEARDDTLVYCCGPEPMLKAVETAMSHWDPHALRLERFSPKEQPAGVDRPFRVTFSLSSVVATIPADRSILSVAEELGLPVESSCREGTCGTCETYVLRGRVDHRDSILTAGERADSETMFICVSRAAEGEEELELEL